MNGKKKNKSYKTKKGCYQYYSTSCQSYTKAKKGKIDRQTGRRRMRGRKGNTIKHLTHGVLSTLFAIARKENSINLTSRLSK